MLKIPKEANLKKSLGGKEDGTTGLETIVETVKKDYNLGNAEAINSSTLSEDKLWLLSDSEIFPKNSESNRYAYTSTKEGEQYKYYELETRYFLWNRNNSRLVKYKSWLSDTNESSSSTWWWLRSPYYNLTGDFCGID